MDIDLGVRVETTQKLIMTPQLQQAIKVLQLSTIDLSALVDEQLLDNPVLDADDQEQHQAADEPVPETEGEKPAEDYFDWMEYFNDGTDLGYGRVNREEQSAPETYAVKPESLADSLLRQLAVSQADGQQRICCEYLIGCIDERGYLTVAVADAAEVCGVRLPVMEKALTVVQSLEPIGVGARSLQECLRLQLAASGQSDSLVEQLVESYLPDVAKGRVRQIADVVHCTPAAVQAAIDVIKGLNPCPGRTFGGAAAHYIVPDVMVRHLDGGFVIIINDGTVPQLTINPYYRHLAHTSADAAAGKFLADKMNSAVWLIRSIEQRRQTLYNVVSQLVGLQQGFFLAGPSQLVPLTMRQLAERLAINESTVSRAVANKYIDTPHGIYSMKYFFSARVAGTAGDVAAVCVRQLLAAAVTAEDVHHPLSDQALVDLLRAQGINISRRTVTKYREQLGIPASPKRRRY